MTGIERCLLKRRELIFLCIGNVIMHHGSGCNGNRSPWTPLCGERYLRPLAGVICERSFVDVMRRSIQRYIEFRVNGKTMTDSVTKRPRLVSWPGRIETKIQNVVKSRCACAQCKIDKSSFGRSDFQLV